MINRREKAKRKYIFRWVSIVLLITVIALFVMSLIYNKNPFSILKSTADQAVGNTDDPLRMNKKTLKQYILSQNSRIDSLAAALAKCDVNRIRTGIVLVNAPTLNMRSEASLTSDILIKIPVGTKVQVNFFAPDEVFLDGSKGNWCNITFADKTGWVWGPYVKLDE